MRQASIYRYALGLIICVSLACTLMHTQAFATEITSTEQVEPVVTNDDKLLFSQVQPGGESAGSEVIEIVFVGDGLMSLEGIEVQYQSLSSERWLTKITLEGSIADHQRAAFATYELEGEYYSGEFNPGLAQTGGRLRIIDQNSLVLDQIEWGEDAYAVELGQSIKRIYDPLVMYFIDEDDQSDFFVDFDSKIGQETLNDYMPPETEDVSPEDMSESTSDQTQTPVSDESQDDEAAETPEPDDQQSVPKITAGDILITQVQTEADSAGQEFVEIFNTTDEPIDAGRYKLQYASSSLSSWTDKVVGLGVIESSVLTYLTSSDYLGELSSGEFSPGFSSAGGAVRIIDIDETTEVDRVLWGTAGSGELDASSGSIKRLYDIETDLFLDTDSESDHFVDQDVNPGQEDHTSYQPEPAEQTTEASTDSQDPVETTVVKSDVDILDVSYFRNLQPLVISELFPDPTEPQTDAQDEFVELYNPNNVTVEAGGLGVQTGSNYTYRQVIPEGVRIGPGSYYVLTSGGSSITLSNSGGAARVTLPDGTQWGRSVTYDKALAGKSYALNDGDYVWTSTPTRAAPNLITASASGAPSSGGSTSSASSSGASGSSGAEQFSTAALPDSISFQAVLTVVTFALLALLYLGYEYRHEIHSRVQRFRRNS
ncbi:MAG: lamin tail domain-containing protein [Patescibacteria group bacterium]